MSIEITLALLSLIISLASAYFAARSVRYARDSIISSVILEVSKAFDEESMKEGNRYLFNLRNSNYEEFSRNPYGFARSYLDKVDESSKEWYYRRTVARFWSRIGALLKTGLLSEDLVFTLFPDVDVIEILEPIEMAMVDKFGIKGDPYIALVYRRWQSWKKKVKYSEEMQLPLNPQSYSASKIRE